MLGNAAGSNSPLEVLPTAIKTTYDGYQYIAHHG